MSTLFEYYNTGDDSYGGMFATLFLAQTFTPSVSHIITSVKLKIGRVGVAIGNFNVGITATSGGHPTGGDLCSGSMAGSDIGTSADWEEITLGGGYNLSAGTTYRI